MDDIRKNLRGFRSSTKKNQSEVSGRNVLSLFLLFLVPLWIFLIAPEILKLPKNFSFSADVISVDNFYDEESGNFRGEQYSQTKYTYDSVSVSGEHIVLNHSFEVRTPENELIFSAERLYGVDRSTGEHVPNLGDKPRDGYLFAPKSLKQNEGFTYWHINYDAPAQMSYVGTDELYGLNTYVYETNYEGQRIDQTDNLTYLPGVGTERGVEVDPYLKLWIEPATGRLVKYMDLSTAYFYDLDTGERQNPWNRFSNTFSEDSVEEISELITNLRIKIRLVNIFVPIFLLVSGLLTSGVFYRIRERYTFFTKKDNICMAVGLFTVISGLIVLVGWLFSTPTLVQAGIFGNATMNPLTAICFILIGGIITFQNQLKLRGSMSLSLVILTLVTIRILGFYEIIDWDIDRTLFTNDVLDSGSRMSFFTAVSIFLLAFAIFTSGVSKLKKLRIAEITALTTLVLSCILIIEYLFGVFEITVLPFFRNTSFNTSILLLVTSMAVLFGYRSKNAVNLSAISNVIVISTLLSSILVTIAITGIVSRNSIDQSEDSFDEQIVLTTRLIEDNLKIDINLLEGAEGLISASNEVTRAEWKAYVDSLAIESNYPGIQGIGYSIFVTPEDREQHIEAIRAEGFPDFAIRPEGERDIYSSIIFLEPFDVRNQQAFGFDMFSEPTRRLAMELARDSGIPKLSGRITLVQEIDEDVQPGFLIYNPIYEKGTENDTVEARRENIVGYTYSPFRARNFILGAIGDEGLKDIGLRIYDGIVENPTAESVLYDDINKLGGVTEFRFEKSQTIFVAGRPWTIEYKSSPNYGSNRVTDLLPLGMIAIGTTISILVTLVTYVIISSRQSAIAYADKVTKNLKEAKAKDEAMLISIGNGLVATDAKGKIVLINKKFTELLGWTEEEAIGKSFQELVPMIGDDGKEIPVGDRMMTKTLNDKLVSNYNLNKRYYVRKDGTKFPISLSVAPIIVQGSVEGAVEIFRDVTIEKEIDQAKTEFVSLASHQLRTPLTAIRWYTEMLTSNGKTSKKDEKEYKQEILVATEQMSELIESLLNVSRIELGTFAVDPEPTDLMELLESVMNELKIVITKKMLKVKIHKVKLPNISVDPKLFRIVYQNVINNAVKYTPDEGNIEIKHETHGNDLIITIKDDGHGIPKSQQGQVFQKLFRADNIQQLDTTGTGLGLYITKSIIDASDGEIWFESEENKGTTFFVRVPLTGMRKREGSKKLE